MVENVLIKLNRDGLELKLILLRHAWIRQCCEIPQSCDPVCSKNIIHKHISISFIIERIIISTRNDTTPNRRHSDFLLVDEWDRRSVRVNHHDSNVTLLINLSTHDHHQIRRIKVREREVENRKIRTNFDFSLLISTLDSASNASQWILRVISDFVSFLVHSRIVDRQWMMSCRLKILHGSRSPSSLDWDYGEKMSEFLIDFN